MKPLDIVPFGHPALRQAAAPVRVFHKKFQAFLDALAATLSARGDGAALAAPQVAVLKRAVVMHYRGEHLELVNPRIVAAEGEAEAYEGCLSFPGYVGLVRRPDQVVVAFQDRQGAPHRIARAGDIARCLQHEIDHLDGILFVDRMTEPFLVESETERRLELPVVQQLVGPPPAGLRPGGKP
jgi:peptide deformylase